MDSLPNKQYKAKQYLELIPVLLLVINAITYIYFQLSESGSTVFIPQIFLVTRHFFESSFITLIVLWAISKQWNSFSRNCISLLLLLWCLNSIYIPFEIPIDVYYNAGTLIVYAIFVFLIVKYVLTRR